jgi:hypothetical protein
MRILHMLVVVSLVLAAAYVYDIKFESTLQASRVIKLHADIRRERDAIAALRAEWATLDNPARLQGLARRNLSLQSIRATQFDSLDQLPPRAPEIVKPGSDAPVDAMADGNPDPDGPTGSIPDAPRAEGAQ